MRAAFRIAHKYLALCVAALWVLQALSGIVLVFHRSIDDRMLGASGAPADLNVIDAAVAGVEQRTPGTRVIEYFPSGGAAGQIDLLTDSTDGEREVVRVDGATGSILRTRAWEEPAADLGLFRFVLLFHKQLLAGATGDWIIGVSGVLLFINIVLGLRLAWPAGQRWRAALLPPRVKALPAMLFGLHRAFGLWLAALGLITASTGALMAWGTGLERALGAGVVPPVAIAPLAHGERTIAPSRAAATALRAFDDATLAVVSFPSERRPWYAIRVRQPEELRQTFGTTLVYVDARSGDVLKSRDALQAPAGARFVAALWPVHSGEWGGIATRVLTLIAGLWLVATAGLGLTLWWKRRRARKLRAHPAVLVRRSSRDPIES